MIFATPGLLLALPVLALWALWRWRRPRRGTALVVADLDVAAIATMTTWRTRLRWLPAATRLAVIALLVVAMAQPRQGLALTPVPEDGIDIVVALDVSSSMDNFSVSRDRTRLQAAREVVTEFVETLEGNRVNREWLYHYMNKPYSMRRTLTIAMPIFHFPDDESRLMADYMAHVFVDSQLGAAWRLIRDQAVPQRGKALFKAKGCIACHQLHGTGGDVGPSLTTQVPEFPHGTWVGDKLKGEWIYPWLKNPQALLPDTIEPNLGLSDQEAIDLTAYLLTLKNPEFQKPAIQKSKVQKDAEPQEKK